MKLKKGQFLPSFAKATVLTMRGAPSAGILFAADEAATGNVCQRSCLTIAQGHIDVLPPARLGSTQERCHDAVARVQARGKIGNGNADLDGRAISLTGNVHQPKFSLDHDIVASATGIRAGLAIASDGGVNEAGVDLANSLVIH